MFLKKILLWLFIIVGLIGGCKGLSKEEPIIEEVKLMEQTLERIGSLDSLPPIKRVIVSSDVPLRSYFTWMDSITAEHNEKYNYKISEYTIVHNNPWILDTLAHSDYYYLMEKGIFNEDPLAFVALKKGQSLLLPDSTQNQLIQARLANTYLDVNIPEFKIRIVEYGKEKYKFPVRVGQNRKRYLAMAKREVDLRTKPGVGKIVRVNKAPTFINPRDNRVYRTTKRDDNKVTKLPNIPWIEPEIGGRRLGQLIHPTTNMATLNKPSSNGCIGLRESDAWFIYYFAPVGTKIVIRYDLQGKNDEGQEVEFENIYPGFEDNTFRKQAIAQAMTELDGTSIPICDCRQ